jgi:hypothetical protein
MPIRTATASGAATSRAATAPSRSAAAPSRARTRSRRASRRGPAPTRRSSSAPPTRAASRWRCRTCWPAPASPRPRSAPRRASTSARPTRGCRSRRSSSSAGPTVPGIDADAFASTRGGQGGLHRLARPGRRADRARRGPELRPTCAPRPRGQCRRVPLVRMRTAANTSSSTPSPRRPAPSAADGGRGPRHLRGVLAGGRQRRAAARRLAPPRRDLRPPLARLARASTRRRCRRRSSPATCWGTRSPPRAAGEVRCRACEVEAKASSGATSTCSVACRRRVGGGAGGRARLRLRAPPGRSLPAGPAATCCGPARGDGRRPRHLRAPERPPLRAGEPKGDSGDAWLRAIRALGGEV